MKSKFKHYVMLSGKSMKDIASELNDSGRLKTPTIVSEQLLHNWVRRDTPIIVDFNHRTFSITSIKREHVVLEAR